MAAVQNKAQVALEGGSSPQMIFRHYRELVRRAGAGKWFGITPEAVEAQKTVRQNDATGRSRRCRRWPRWRKAAQFQR